MNIKKILISDTSISFIITNKLKTTKQVLKLKVVKCVRNENHDDLILSSKTKKCFWLGGSKLSSHYPELILKIFCSPIQRCFTILCNSKGVYLNDILKTGDWTDADTFVNHYYAQTSDTPVGQIILYELVNSVKIFNSYVNLCFVLIYFTY